MLNPKDVLVTTTSTLQNIDIVKYLRPISAQIVAGAGFLSDFGASFTDIFGGRSSSYQNRLSSLYDDAIYRLKKQAVEIGANCILGLTVDMDEISGKGKEMFMISAIGTAVVMGNEKSRNTSPTSESKVGHVSIENLQILRRKNQIIADAENGSLYLDADTWDFIHSNQVPEIFGFIVKKLRSALKNEDDFPSLYKNALNYLNGLPEEIKLRLVYGSIMKEDNEAMADKFCEIICQLRLLDFKFLSEILTLQDFTKQKKALKIISYDKDFYGIDDVETFQIFIPVINEKFQERGVRSMKKQMLSSKEKEIWTCECGKINDIGQLCSSCEKDIYGFRSDEIGPVKAVIKIEEKVNLILEAVKEWN